VDLDKIAEITHGYVGADLAAVAMKAATSCIRRSAVGLVDMKEEDIPAEFLESLAVKMSDFTQAVKETGSSTIRDVTVRISFIIHTPTYSTLSLTHIHTHTRVQVSKPNVSFKDIGGLENVKKELQEMINFPSKYEELFQDIGVRPPTGSLLYGPPGCGKTLLAKAMAAECDANFISIKGPQLLTKWFGESEENVRGIFEKARQSAPCVLFFDELDSIATKRGGFQGDHGVSNRIVNQLLTEMDGIGKRTNVFVIGATNRPDTLDPAILRPGRLDQKIHIPMPDLGARLAILKAGLRKTPVEKGVDLEKLANLTEGYSGSDLAGMLQLAVKISVRKRIEAVHIERDRILKEAQKKEKAMDDAATSAGDDDNTKKKNKIDRMTPKKAMSLAKEKLLKTGEWTIKGEDLSKAFTLQRKSIKPADLDNYNSYAKKLQAKMGISSQLTTNQTKTSGMFELPEGETNEHQFDSLPPLK